MSVVSLESRRPRRDPALHAERVRHDRALRAEQARTREAEQGARYWKRAYEELFEAVAVWHDCPYCGVHTPDPTCPEHRDLVALDPNAPTATRRRGQ